MTKKQVETLLVDLTETERRAVLQLLREKYRIKIHTLEEQWNTTAEAILEAIHNASDLIQRGVRGVLAEAAFRTIVLPKQLSRWRDIGVVGDQPYDLLLADGDGRIRVQVKLQRRQAGMPKYYRRTNDHFVVETQRTRSGRRKDQQESRPYRIDEFDVLAVCLHPSTGDWTSFIYCASSDLKVRTTNPGFLEVLQPIPIAGSEVWSHDFDSVVIRHRASGQR